MRVSYKKLTAFTLSEVLITLGIIGVVSTLTLPNLTNSYRRNVAMTKIEKGYAQLAQAYEQRVNDIGDVPAGTYTVAGEGEDEKDNATVYFDTYWRPYLKSPILCDTYQDCGYSSNTPFTPRFNNDGTTGHIKVIDKQRHATFMTNEGIVYMDTFIHTSDPSGESSFSTSAGQIYMDINGGKSPNVFGRDVFVFVRAGDDGLMPVAYNSDHYAAIEEICLERSGATCAEYLRRKGWEAPRDYQF